MLSDIFILAGFGLIDPILAIFINDSIRGGTIFAAGLASTVFLLAKSIVQLPFSRYADRSRDRVRWLIIGTAFIVVVPFLYIFAQDISTIYLAQIFHGIGSGLAFPTWLGLWSTNLGKSKEGFEWSLYSTLTGLGAAATAAIGAAAAQFFGFVATFAVVGILSMIGCGILFALEGAPRHRKTRRPRKCYQRKDLIKESGSFAL